MSLETFLLLSLLVELCYCFNLNYIASFVESMLFFHIYWEVYDNLSFGSQDVSYMFIC